jgi:hypothetical protein
MGRSRSSRSGTAPAPDAAEGVRVLEGEAHALRVADAEIVIAPLDLDALLAAPPETGAARRRPRRRQGALRDAALAPPPAAAAGGPVHRALLVGGRLEDAVALGRACAAAGDDGAAAGNALLVRLAVVREGAAGSQDTAQDWVSLVDVGAAAGAIEAMRASARDNAVAYERAWFASGAAALADWLYAGTGEQAGGALRPADKAFVAAVLDDAAARLDVAEQEARDPRRRIGADVKEELLGAVGEWSVAAHKELGALFDGDGEWAGLSWWKLPLRADDVGMLAAEVVEKSWLVGAERDLVGLGGLFRGAGVVGKDGFGPAEQREVAAEKELEAKEMAETTETADSTEKTALQPANGPSKAIYSASTESATSSAPPYAHYPKSLTTTRSTLTSRISALQSSANTHTLAFLSTGSLSTALSALIYISSPLSTLYGSFTVAALGTALGAWRLAAQWTRDKKAWEEAVREEGRRALLESEDVLRGAVERCERGVDEGLLRDVKEGREAVQEVRDALARMGE